MVTTHNDNRKQAEELAEIILNLHRSLLIKLSSKLSNGKISIQQFTLLGFLYHTPNLTMTQLANKMGHTTAAATGLVDRLQDAGLIERTGEAMDRRKKIVRITKSGLSVYEGLKAEMADNVLKIFTAIGSDDQAAWMRIYRYIHKECHTVDNADFYQVQQNKPTLVHTAPAGYAPVSVPSHAASPEAALA